MSGRGWQWIGRMEWQDIVGRSPMATFFHTPEWCECMAVWLSARYTPRALGFCLKDGTRVALPVMIRKSIWRFGPLVRGVSTFPNTYGGPVAEGRCLTDTDWDELAGAVHTIPMEKLAIHATPGQIPPPGLKSLFDLTWTDRNTYLVRLNEIQGELINSYRSNCARNVRKGRQAGLAAGRISSAEEISEYYQMYLASIDRWGSNFKTAYPATLFQELNQIPGVEIWGTRLSSGKMVSGGVFLYFNRWVVYWHGAMHIEYQDIRPTNYLFDFLMEDARQRGFHFFDFNPSSNLKGVETFKASFGAHPAPSPRWTWRGHLIHQLVSRGRNSK